MEFVIARSPDPASSLPYLLRVPLGPNGIALKARDTWPRTSRVYCHRADGWPDDLDPPGDSPALWAHRRRRPADD